MDVHVPEAGHQVPAFEIDDVGVRVSGERLPSSTSTMRPRSMTTLAPGIGRG